MKQVLLLGFDIEEFDLPLECSGEITFEEQLSVSTEGTNVILDILAEYKIKATFFCTANFALNRPELIQRIINEGHELASHGYFHGEFKSEDYQRSKKVFAWRVCNLLITNAYRQRVIRTTLQSIPLGFRDVIITDRIHTGGIK